MQRSVLGRFRLTLLAQPKTLQQCRHGVAEAAILQLGIGQHRGPRPALAAHLDSFALGALADLVPRRVVEEIGTGLRKAAFFVDRKAGARNDRQAVAGAATTTSLRTKFPANREINREFC